MTLLSRVEALTGPEEALPLNAWSEDDGDVLWWCWTGSKWAGEPPYVGSPLDCGRTYEGSIGGQHIGPIVLGGWPGYHTHWTRLPPMPAVLRAKEGT